MHTFTVRLVVFTYKRCNHSKSLPLQCTYALEDIDCVFILELVEQHDAHAEDRTRRTTVPRIDRDDVRR